MKNVVVILVLLLAGIFAYLYFVEPAALDRILGHEPSHLPAASDSAKRNIPGKSPNEKLDTIPAANASLEIPTGDWQIFLNGEPAAPGSTVSVRAGEVVVAAYAENRFSHEVLSAKPAGSYQPALRAEPAPATSAWDTFQGNRFRTGFVSAKNRSDLRLKWMINLENDKVESSPILRGDQAYFSSEHHLLNAIDLKAGKLLWSEGNLGSTVSPITNEDYLFAGNDRGEFTGYRLRDGKPRGSTSLDSYAVSLALISDEAFLAVTRTNEVFCLKTKKGVFGRLPLNVIWQTPVPELAGSSATPVILADRAIFQTAKGELLALSLDDGKRLWPATGAETEIIELEVGTFLAEDKFLIATPASDGSSIFSIRDRSLRAFRASDGGVSWERALAYVPTSSVSLAYGMIYLGGVDGAVYAHSSTGGAPIFRTKVSAKPVFASPVIFGDKLLIATAEGSVMLLHAFSGRILAEDNSLAGSPIESTPAVSDQYILAINKKGSIACFD